MESLEDLLTLLFVFKLRSFHLPDLIVQDLIFILFVLHVLVIFAQQMRFTNFQCFVAILFCDFLSFDFLVFSSSSGRYSDMLPSEQLREDISVVQVAVGHDLRSSLPMIGLHGLPAQLNGGISRFSTLSAEGFL